MPLGNVYYYFKTKEAIDHALIEQMTSEVGAKHATLDQHADPKARLEAFVQIPTPIVRLSPRAVVRLARSVASSIKTAARWRNKLRNSLPRAWGGWGRSSVRWARTTKRATLLTHSFGDTSYIERVAERLKLWIRSL